MADKVTPIGAAKGTRTPRKAGGVKKAPAAPVSPPGPPAPTGGPPAGPRRGRPSYLTDELADTVCGYLQTGLSVRDAAVASGTTSEAVRRWLRCAQEALAAQGIDAAAGMEYDADAVEAATPHEEVRRYLRFYWKYQAADSTGVSSLALKVHTSRDPKIALALLARRRPEQFKEAVTIEVQGEVDVQDARSHVLAMLERRAQAIEATAVPADG